MTDRSAEGRACAGMEVLLTRAVDEVLSPDEEVALDRHLAGCPACAGTLAAHRALRTSIAGLPPVDVPPAFTARVLSAVPRRRSLFDALDFRRWTWRLAPVAAALALWTVTSLAADEASRAQASEVSVPAAFYADAVSGEELLSLMLTAGADQQLTEALEESQP